MIVSDDFIKGMVEDWRDLEIHRFADIFPEMLEDEFERFVENIRDQGVKIPIVLFEGKVLEGKHRFKASLIINVKPPFMELPAGDDPVEFVRSANQIRRMMTYAAQKAEAALNYAMLQEERGHEGIDDETLAYRFTTSVNSLRRARTIRREMERFEELKSLWAEAVAGKVNLSKTYESCKRLVKREEDRKMAEMRARLIDSTEEKVIGNVIKINTPMNSPKSASNERVKSTPKSEHHPNLAGKANIAPPKSPRQQEMLLEKSTQEPFVGRTRTGEPAKNPVKTPKELDTGFIVCPHCGDEILISHPPGIPFNVSSLKIMHVSKKMHTL